MRPIDTFCVMELSKTRVSELLPGIIFHLYKINVLIDNAGQKDYNRQRICYNIIFVMLYSLKPDKHGLFYL